MCMWRATGEPFGARAIRSAPNQNGSSLYQIGLPGSALTLYQSTSDKAVAHAYLYWENKVGIPSVESEFIIMRTILLPSN